MVSNTFLTFHGNNIITTQKQLFTNIQNTFTIEFWAKPGAAHGFVRQSKQGITKKKNLRFAVTPIFGAYGDGNDSRAGVGVSVGKNGVSVYEHTTNYLPATLVFNTPLNGWTHIAVVYNNKIPTLFINGQFAKKGSVSPKEIVVPSGVFGGLDSYGFYVGGLKEIRIWSTAKTQSEICQNMNRELIGNEAGLFGYWKLNEGVGINSCDSTPNKNNGTIKGATWNGLQNTISSDKSINVLFAFYTPSGGVETLNRQRFYALNKKEINCHFLYTQPGTGQQNKINTDIFVTNNDNEIKNIILKGNYEAIVVTSNLLLLKKIREFKYKGFLIYESQGLGFNKKKANQYWKAHTSPINRYCDAILYPATPHLIKAFNTHLPFKRKFCFNNCFNTEEFKYQVYPQKDNPIIGWVGRIEENKNWKEFLSIGSKLIQENPSIQLWMFEDNTLSTKAERSAFKQKIDELNLKNHLTVYANQQHSKMAKYFSIIGDSGGFLCSTSIVEGFGYAVLEAMVCRCPVLSTDSDGVRSFIKHNITGKFYKLGNIVQAVKEAKELISNNQLRQKIRTNGVKHIEAHFSPDNYAENFLNMINYLNVNLK